MVGGLFDEQGRRFFFNYEDRAAFIEAANRQEGKTRTFCSLLHYTGCNFTEALTMTARQVDFAGQAILIPRKADKFRATPVPPSFLELLDRVHDLRRVQGGMQASERIWPQSKKTMHEKVSLVIAEAGISGGPHAVPKGIRHGFLAHAIRNRIILTRVQKWLGHSHIDHTAVYAELLALHAPELIGDERADAALMW